MGDDRPTFLYSSPVPDVPRPVCKPQHPSPSVGRPPRPLLSQAMVKAMSIPCLAFSFPLLAVCDSNQCSIAAIAEALCRV